MLKRPPTSDTEYPNDRLPSEQVIGFYALRGYRHPQGRDVLVCAAPYFDAVPVEKFLTWHAQDLARRGHPVPKDMANHDVQAIRELAEQCDAVRIVPAY